MSRLRFRRTVLGRGLTVLGRGLRPRIGYSAGFAGFVAVLLCSTSALAQGAKTVVVEVRSTDPEQILDVSVAASGGAAFGLTVWNGAPGHVFQKGDNGTGTTPLLVHVEPKPGQVRISVPSRFPALRAFVQGDTTKKLLATGHTIDIVRDSTGAVSMASDAIKKP